MAIPALHDLEIDSGVAGVKIEWGHVRHEEGAAMPPKTTLDEAHHFGIFILKTVLDGRGA